MELRIPIQKYHFTADRKTDFFTGFIAGRYLRYNVTQYNNTWESYGWGEKLYFGIVMEKHRGKTRVVEARQKKGPNGMMVGPKFKREVVKKNHWKIIVHVFPENLLNMAGVYVVQKARTFELVKRR